MKEKLSLVLYKQNLYDWYMCNKALCFFNVIAVVFAMFIHTWISFVMIGSCLGLMFANRFYEDVVNKSFVKRD